MPFATLTTPVNLKRVRVRLINTDEGERWDALMRAHHYLGLVGLVGRSLRYVAEIDGHWLAGPLLPSKWQAGTTGLAGLAGRPRCNCSARH